MSHVERVHTRSHGDPHLLTDASERGVLEAGTLGAHDHGEAFGPVQVEFSWRPSRAPGGEAQGAETVVVQ